MILRERSPKRSWLWMQILAFLTGTNINLLVMKGGLPPQSIKEQQLWFTWPKRKHVRVNSPAGPHQALPWSRQASTELSSPDLCNSFKATHVKGQRLWDAEAKHLGQFTAWVGACSKIWPCVPQKEKGMEMKQAICRLGNIQCGHMPSKHWGV